MARSHHVVSSFFLEKFSGSPALNSVSPVIRATSMQLSSAGSKVSSSLSLVITILGSGMGSKLGLGRVVIVMGHLNASRGYVFSCLLPFLMDCLSQINKALS